jgi:predicted DNA-binding transcriptional regulator AlpA
MPKESDRLLRMDEILRITGLSISKILRLEQQGQFPTARKVGRARAWLSSEVQEWMKRLPKVGEMR